MWNSLFRSAVHPYMWMKIQSTPTIKLVLKYQETEGIKGDSAKTGVIWNIPRYIAKYGKPLPYFMKYRSDYYAKQKKLSKAYSNMNRLCYDIEFWQKKNIRFKKTYKDFDYMIMVDKNIPIDNETFAKIEEIFKDYNKTMKKLKMEVKMLKSPNLYKDYLTEVFPDYTLSDMKNFVVNWEWYYQDYKKKCLDVCPNIRELANYCVLLCYEKYKSNNKKFMWKMAGEGINMNLKQTTLSLPQRCSKEESEFEYLGKNYMMKEIFVVD